MRKKYILSLLIVSSLAMVACGKTEAEQLAEKAVEEVEKEAGDDLSEEDLEILEELYTEIYEDELSNNGGIEFVAEEEKKDDESDSDNNINDEIYQNLLEQFKSDSSNGFEFVYEELIYDGYTQYEYTYYDINDDGRKELIVRTPNYEDGYYYNLFVPAEKWSDAFLVRFNRYDEETHTMADISGDMGIIVNYYMLKGNKIKQVDYYEYYCGEKFDEATDTYYEANDYFHNTEDNVISEEEFYSQKAFDWDKDIASDWIIL